MATKISFPNRACPGCGKAIHIKSKAHECGWSADGQAASSPAPKAQAKKAPAKDKSISKMEAVRRILKAHGNDTMPLAIQSHLMKEYGIKMEASVISNYKGNILKKEGKNGTPKGPKVAKAKVAPAGATTEISLDDIRAVKQLVDQLGAEKVQELAAVLAK